MKIGNVLLAVLLLLVGQGTAFSAEKDTVVVVTDTVTVDKKAKPAKKPRHECAKTPP